MRLEKQLTRYQKQIAKNKVTIAKQKAEMSHLRMQNEELNRIAYDEEHKSADCEPGEFPFSESNISGHPNGSLIGPILCTARSIQMLHGSWFMVGSWFGVLAMEGWF